MINTKLRSPRHTEGCCSRIFTESRYKNYYCNAPLLNPIEKEMGYCINCHGNPMIKKQVKEEYNKN